MAAANNFGSFMNALSFVNVVSRTWIWFQPKTQVEVLHKALRERQKELEEARKLGIDVRSFTERLELYVFSRRLRVLDFRRLKKDWVL